MCPWVCAFTPPTTTNTNQVFTRAQDGCGIVVGGGEGVKHRLVVISSLQKISNLTVANLAVCQTMSSSFVVTSSVAASKSIGPESEVIKGRKEFEVIYDQNILRVLCWVLGVLESGSL